MWDLSSLFLEVALMWITDLFWMRHDGSRHDSCGERSNNRDNQLAFNNEWLSVVGSSTLD